MPHSGIRGGQEKDGRNTGQKRQAAESSGPLTTELGPAGAKWPFFSLGSSPWGLCSGLSPSSVPTIYPVPRGGLACSESSVITGTCGFSQACPAPGTVLGTQKAGMRLGPGRPSRSGASQPQAQE